jgi:hypothetical protein
VVGTQINVATTGAEIMTTTTSNEFIDGLADFWAHLKRSPVFRRPDEVGLEYEEVFFPSMDGVALDGRFMPAEPDRLIIHNHFMPGNRYGYPGHLEGFTDFGGFEVNFLPAYRALHRRTGFHVDEQSPIEHAKSVQLLTLVAQVHDDVLTRPSDVQTIYDNIPAADKKLFWIEGTDQRFRGYNYFGEHPELMLEWFDTHMK